MAEDSAIPGTTKLIVSKKTSERSTSNLRKDDLRKVRSTASKFTVHKACYPELVEKMTGL